MLYPNLLRTVESRPATIGTNLYRSQRPSSTFCVWLPTDCGCASKVVLDMWVKSTDVRYCIGVLVLPVSKLRYRWLSFVHGASNDRASSSVVCKVVCCCSGARSRVLALELREYSPGFVYLPGYAFSLALSSGAIVVDVFSISAENHIFM